MNWPTSVASLSACRESTTAASSTWLATSPLRFEASSMAATVCVTSRVLFATSCAFRAISCVAVVCCCTDPPISPAMDCICTIVLAMLRSSPTEFRTVACICDTRAPISSVAFAVCAASPLTSFATTEKPLPAAPARAASIVALRASKFVCAATCLINWTTSPTLSASVTNAATAASVRRAPATAVSEIAVERSNFLSISPIAGREFLSSLRDIADVSKCLLRSELDL